MTLKQRPVQRKQNVQWRSLHGLVGGKRGGDTGGTLGISRGLDQPAPAWRSQNTLSEVRRKQSGCPAQCQPVN